MKNKFSLSTILFVLFFSISMNGQDLIDRTRTNVSLNSDAGPNAIAESIYLEKSLHDFKDVSVFSINQERNIHNYEEYLTDAVFLKLNANSLNKTLNTRSPHVNLQIPVTISNGFELELKRVEVLTSDFVLKTSDGRELTYEELPVVFYRGIIKGDPNSTATITVYKNQIKGLITDRDGNYVLAQISNEPGKYTLYNDKNLVEENSYECGSNNDLMTIGTGVEEQVESSNRFVNCIEVFIETDYYTYQEHGSNVNNFQNFITSLFAEVATLYDNENINISLSEVFVWTSTDPYASLNSTSAILEKFGETRQNNYDGRLAHFVTTRGLGGGIAWLDVLCYSYFSFNGDWNGDGYAELHHAGPYAVSGSMSTNVTPVPSYSWNVNVFAHEMGHNLGSPHTQRCAWGPNNNSALDNCIGTEGSCNSGPAPSNGGTVMSYCHTTSYGINFNNGFGDEPGDLIRNKYNSPSCELTCDNALQLPIELLDFSAKENDAKTAILQWITGSEINGSHFEVERQTLGKNWQMIAKVEAVGHTTETQEYYFEDKNPSNGENFYRLKQVDINGEYVYSQIEALTFKGIEGVIFNNPVHDILSININSLATKSLQIEMHDSQGRLIDIRNIDINEGLNTIEWNMSYFPKGIYFMNVVGGNQSMFKLVKM